MTSTTSTTPLNSLSSSSFDTTKLARPSAVTIPSQCVTLPPVPVQVQQPQNRTRRTTTNHCRKIARDVAAMATGETPADVSATELPEVFKTIQEAWDKLDDKYAVTSLGAAVIVGLWGSTGMISAIDRLPLVPGVLELVGIGYSGWFAYKNLIFKPDREALLKKIKDTYGEIIGSN